VVEALHINYFVDQTDFLVGISVHHLEEFVTCWDKIHSIILGPVQRGGIIRYISLFESNSASSAYQMQFLGAASATMKTLG
jgi:hypothetical protein